VGDGAHGSLKRQPIGVLYLTSRNLKGGKLDLSTVDYIDETTFAKYFRSNSKALTMPKAGDVIFGIIGSIGEAYRVRHSDRFGMSSSIAILRPNREIDSDYLYQWVKGHIFQQALYAIKGGVAQGYVSLEMIRSLPLNYPNLTEQRKTAAILSTYDDLIGNHTRRIQILEEMARRIYEEWFVRFRFPGHEHGKMVESVLGFIPEGWSIAKLGDIVSNIRNSTKAGEHLSELPYVPIECISRERLALTEYVSWKEAQSSLILFEELDILFGAMRSYFHKVTIAPFRGVTRTTCFVLRPKSDFLRSFAILTVFAKPTVNFAATNSKGATIPYAVWDGIMANMKIVLPPKRLLVKFDELVNPMLEAIRKSTLRQSNLRHTRDLLLPQLMSGEIDVSDFPEPEAL
jgi:type I restriction enzyme S subunit